MPEIHFDEEIAASYDDDSDERFDMGLLAAASVLEQSVNNTSLFFVLEVGGLRLLFPGDAQYGAWEHVRNNPKRWSSSAMSTSTRWVITARTTRRR